MSKKFSIIIPAYNCESLIKSTLDSIIVQYEKLYECIVVDGLSKDSTVEIVKEYSKRYHNIRFISEKDKGIYDAMNKGIELSQGDYLFFIGAGDRIVDNSLEYVNKELNNSIDFIYGNVICEYCNVKVGYEFNKEEMAIQGICHQAIFYKRNVFDKVGMYNLKYKVFADNVLNIAIIGNDDISKKYVDIDVAYYKGDGVSQNIRDLKYFLDIKDIILNNLGTKALECYITSGRYYYDVLLNEDKEKMCFIGDEENYKYFLEDINLYIENNNMSNSKEFGKFVVKDDKFDLYSLSLNEYKYFIIGTDNNILKEYLVNKLNNTGISIIIPYMRKSDEFMNFLQKEKNKDIIIFGASNLGKRVLKLLKHCNRNDLKVTAIVDNSPQKQGTFFEGYHISNPNEVLKNFKGAVLIASTWKYEILKQLKKLGIKEIISIH